MKGNEFLDKMELIDPAYVEAADRKPARRKNAWIKWVAAAACLCLLGGILVITSHSGSDPQIDDFVLPDKTTAKITLGCDADAVTSNKNELVGLTEEEMFSYRKMYVVRGTVTELTNVTADFNGHKWAMCVATIEIQKVFEGDLVAGQQLKILLPCAITGRITQEDTGIISQLEVGMEGIFMPFVYDEAAYMEMYGAVLIMQDLAPCGLGDGMRWVFLSTDRGLRFLRSAYPGARDAKNLDDIEAYIIKMLK